MNRPSRNQGHTRQLVVRNPSVQTDSGRTLAVGFHVNMDMRRREVEEARRKMQVQYDKQAEEAAQKKKEREQKKREAWLARKEALVRPGHVLGRGGTSEKNLLRDVMEHEDGDECQQHMNNTEQNWIEPQYNALVQQRIERERESVQLQRRQEQSKEVTPARPGDIVRRGAVPGSGPPNRTSDYFLGTGYSTSPASSNNNGHVAQAHIASPGYATGSSNTVFQSNSHGLSNQAAVANSGYVLGTGNATSPKSDNYIPDVRPNYREEMLAARRQLQEQYDAQLKQAAEAKEQEAKDTAERRECSSSN